MIRTPSRPVRVGVALVGVAGALSLAGCGATTAADTGSAQTDAGTTDAGSGSSSSGGYAGGTQGLERVFLINRERNS